MADRIEGHQKYFSTCIFNELPLPLVMEGEQREIGGNSVGLAENVRRERILNIFS